MRSSISIVAFVLVVALTAAAQDTPRVETFFGYEYNRANSATNVPAFSANGGSGQVAFNFSRSFGFVIDMGAVHNGNISDIHSDTTISHYLFGPRLSLRYSRVRPYFNVLFGGSHLGTSIPASLVVPPATPAQPIFIPGQGNTPIGPGQPITARLVASQTAFGMTAGGGLDIKMSKVVSFRLIGLDYYLTRFQNMRSLNDNNQHNIRYTTGLNFTLGAR